MDWGSVRSRQRSLLLRVPSTNRDLCQQGIFPSASRQLNTRDCIYSQKSLLYKLKTAYLTGETFFEDQNQTIPSNHQSSETFIDARAILTKEPVRRKSGPSTLNLLPTAYGDYCSSRCQKCTCMMTYIYLFNSCIRNWLLHNTHTSNNGQFPNGKVANTHVRKTRARLPPN
jgi:hypothetical protein